MAPYMTGDDALHSVEDALRSESPASDPSRLASEIIVFASSRAVIEDRLSPATIIVSTRTGRIITVFHSVLDKEDFPEGTPYTDYSPYILLPGLVDAHVHLNEPGRTEWEGFWHGTRAAAFGGVTTVIDMPLNAIPPTTTVPAMKEKVAAAQDKCWVDVGFYGGIIPGNTSELRALVNEGVRGFKGFLIDSGVDEFPAVSASDIKKAFMELAEEPTTVMFHAEMLPPDAASAEEPSGPLDSYQTFLDSRPSSYETCAIQEILSMAHLAPSLQLHIVHLSAMEAIPMLQKARASGVKITAETCFHYLSLAAEQIKAGDTRHKCCPPIRDQSNQDALWQEMLKDQSVIHTVVSDHSPCTPNLKILPANIPGSVAASSKPTCCSGKDKPLGDFMSAWGGISSVGLGLSILWTETMRRQLDRDETLLNIAKWCCVNTALQVGLEDSKGQLRVGMDADIAVFDDEAEWDVQPSTMLFRNKCSPYEGKKLKGVVRETWLRGRRVHSREAGFVDKNGPSGKLLLEKRKRRST